MAELRHIAMVVEEMEKTSQFYEKARGMQRVRQHETAIGLSTSTRATSGASQCNPAAPEGRKGAS